MNSRSALLGLVVLGVVAACSAQQDDGSEGSSAAVTGRTFDRNNVLDDKSMVDVNGVSTDQIQSLLEKTPWKTTSVLASYTEGGKTAAQLLTDAGQKYKINPLVLLTRLQGEQGLVAKTTAPAATLQKAFGCGCGDGRDCTAEYAGFGNQALCAAETLRHSMDAAPKGTVGGWETGVSKSTLDDLSVKPANAATTALYNYTPWVGEAGGGKKGVGGASLLWQVWGSLAKATGYAIPTTTTPTTSTDAGAPPAPTTTADAGTPPSDPDAAAPTGDDDDSSGDDSSGDDDSSDSGAPVADAGAPTTSADAGASSQGTTSADQMSAGSQASGGTAPPDAESALPRASEADLAGTPKSSSGCSTSPSGAPTDAMLFAFAAGLVLAGSRRKRKN